MINQDKIQNLKDYFVLVRQRPGMYLGKNTISKLHDHLKGYSMAYWFNNIDNPIDKNFFDNFNDFVYRYYGVTTNDNWKGVILEQCFGNEERALITFFELFDLFVDNVKTTDSKQIVLELFDKLIFRKENIDEKLGDNYKLILSEILDLIKENALSSLKYDYDGILEQIKEKSEQITELNTLIIELEKEHSS